MWIPSSSHNYVFKNPEHLVLRGLGFLSIIVHILTSLQCGLSMTSGENSSFKNSQAAMNMFYLKLAVFIITIVSLILLAFHFFSLSCTNLARLSGLLIFIALCIHMVSKQYLRSLSYEKGDLTIHAYESTNTTGQITPIESCSRQYSALWPTEALELYSKAQKVLCTEVCPCADSETKGAINYQDCLKLSGSTEQYHFKKVLKQLMAIEKEIQCSGVCMQFDKYYFSDSRVASIIDQKYPNCFEKGLKYMEKQLISGETGNHAFDLLLLTIALNILSEIIRHVHLRHFWQKIKRICPQKIINNPSSSNSHDFKIFSDESIETEEQQQSQKQTTHPNNIVHLIDVNLLNSMKQNHDDHDHDHSVHATPIITKQAGPQIAGDEHFQALNH